MLLRSDLLASIDRVSFSTVWIGVCGVFVASNVSTLPDRFGDAVDCASHPALRHPATIRRNGATRDLTVNARATASAVHHIVKHVATLERETHADGWVIKEATRATTVRIVAAVPTPRVGEEWVRHGMVQLAKDGLEKSEGVCEVCMMRPWMVERIFREGHILLPAGVMRAAAMARPLWSRGWRRPNPCLIVSATLSGVDKDFICVVNLSKLVLCRCFLFLGYTIGVGLERPFLVSLSDLILGSVPLYAEDFIKVGGHGGRRIVVVKRARGTRRWGGLVVAPTCEIGRAHV